MKQQLKWAPIGVSLLALLGMSSPAMAQDKSPIDLQLGGYFIQSVNLVDVDKEGASSFEDEVLAQNGEIYFALTNNNASNRTPTKVDAANPRAYMDVDGKKGAGNPNGHIIRFKEDGQSATAMGFAWDIFVFGAEEDAGDANLSGLTAKNAFSSLHGNSTGVPPRISTISLYWPK